MTLQKTDETLTFYSAYILYFNFLCETVEAKVNLRVKNSKVLTFRITKK